MKTFKKLRKVFDPQGDAVVRIAARDTEGIKAWLDGYPIETAIEYAKEVQCKIFGKALDFPARIEEYD